MPQRGMKVKDVGSPVRHVAPSLYCNTRETIPEVSLATTVEPNFQEMLNRAKNPTYLPGKPQIERKIQAVMCSCISEQVPVALESYGLPSSE